jgi:tetratricopeptide (TPR) repeat protein
MDETHVRTRLSALLLGIALVTGCAALPVEQPPPPEAGEAEVGAGPRLPPELPATPDDVAPEPRLVPLPEPVPVPPADPAPSYHPAGETLVEQARREALMGNEASAGATLERALRIDGNNPWIWIELGFLRLEAGQPAAAEGMARKALSLAARDPQARAAALDLLQRTGARP